MPFAKPDQEDENEPKLTETEKKELSLQETRRSSPIFPFRDDLIQAIENHQVLIIEGKTTQIAQYLYEAGFTRGGKEIGCTQMGGWL
jgi:pre-mRNA-splicing factor ATP-dependent RNA helicase DHX16